MIYEACKANCYLKGFFYPSFDYEVQRNMLHCGKNAVNNK